jgi:RNA polymerase sigma-70 factor (ECF subfamily)
VDRDLVNRAQGGDLDAFSILVAPRSRRLYAAARLILRDDDQADDVVQDALLEAWMDLRALRDPDRFDAWLHRLLIRRCYRAAKRHRSRTILEIDISADVQPQVPDGERALALHDQLERGFRRLSTEQRTVLVLRHYLDLSITEAAAVLGVPVGTVQSRQNRATRAMRAALEADDRSPELSVKVAR